MPSVSADVGVAWGIMVPRIASHRQCPVYVMSRRRLRIRLRPFANRVWICISGRSSGTERLFQDDRLHDGLDALVLAPEGLMSAVLSAAEPNRRRLWIESYRDLPFELVHLRYRDVRRQAFDRPPSRVEAQ